MVNAGDLGVDLRGPVVSGEHHAEHLQTSKPFISLGMFLGFMVERLRVKG